MRFTQTNSGAGAPTDRGKNPSRLPSHAWNQQQRSQQKENIFQDCHERDSVADSISNFCQFPSTELATRRQAPPERLRREISVNMQAGSKHQSSPGSKGKQGILRFMMGGLGGGGSPSSMEGSPEKTGASQFFASVGVRRGRTGWGQKHHQPQSQLQPQISFNGMGGDSREAHRQEPTGQERSCRNALAEKSSHASDSWGSKEADRESNLSETASEKAAQQDDYAEKSSDRRVLNNNCKPGHQSHLSADFALEPDLPVDPQKRQQELGQPRAHLNLDDMFRDADHIDCADLLTEELDEPVLERPTPDLLDQRSIKRSVSVGTARFGPGEESCTSDAATCAAARAAAVGILPPAMFSEGFQSRNGVPPALFRDHLMMQHPPVLHSTYSTGNFRSVSPMQSERMQAYNLNSASSLLQEQIRRGGRDANASCYSLPPSPGNKIPFAGLVRAPPQNKAADELMPSVKVTTEEPLRGTWTDGPVSMAASAAIMRPSSAVPSRIKVVVRKRPLNKKEIAKSEFDVIVVTKPDRLTVEEPKQKVDLTKYTERHDFSFDAVFDEDVSNDEVYEQTVGPIVPTIFERTKATCFAYGQTGSGKTFTMQPLPLRAAEDFLGMLEEPQRQSQGLHLWISFFEIYGGKLFDLLHDRNKLQMREDGKQQVCIVGLQEVKVSSVETVRELIQRGNGARSTGATGANESSSRSHAILQMAIKKPPVKVEEAPRSRSRRGRPGTAHNDLSKDNEIRMILVGKLSFIDLAGSERGADTTDNDKQTRMEGAEINKSLLALKECIRALGAEQNHIPFRGSKLTEVLRDSFMGKSCTVMLSCISPSSGSVEHTLNTLRYTERVKALPRVGSGMVSANTAARKERDSSTSGVRPPAAPPANQSSSNSSTSSQTTPLDESEFYASHLQPQIGRQMSGVPLGTMVHTNGVAGFKRASAQPVMSYSFTESKGADLGMNSRSDHLQSQDETSLHQALGTVHSTVAASAALRSHSTSGRPGWKDRTPERTIPTAGTSGAAGAAGLMGNGFGPEFPPKNRFLDGVPRPEQGLKYPGFMDSEVFASSSFISTFKIPITAANAADLVPDQSSTGALTSVPLTVSAAAPALVPAPKLPSFSAASRGMSGYSGPLEGSSGATANRQQWRAGATGIPSGQAPRTVSSPRLVRPLSPAAKETFAARVLALGDKKGLPSEIDPAVEKAVATKKNETYGPTEAAVVQGSGEGVSKLSHTIGLSQKARERLEAIAAADAANLASARPSSDSLYPDETVYSTSQDSGSLTAGTGCTTESSDTSSAIGRSSSSSASSNGVSAKVSDGSGAGSLDTSTVPDEMQIPSSTSWGALDDEVMCKDHQDKGLDVSASGCCKQDGEETPAPIALTEKQAGVDESKLPSGVTTRGRGGRLTARQKAGAASKTSQEISSPPKTDQETHEPGSVAALEGPQPIAHRTRNGRVKKVAGSTSIPPTASMPVVAKDVKGKVRRGADLAKKTKAKGASTRPSPEAAGELLSASASDVTEELTPSILGDATAAVQSSPQALITLHRNTILDLKSALMKEVDLLENLEKGLCSVHDYTGALKAILSNRLTATLGLQDALSVHSASPGNDQ